MSERATRGISPRLWFVAVSLFAVATGLYVGRIWTGSEALARLPSPTHGWHLSGREWELVFIGSSGCAYSSADDVIDAVRRAKDKLGVTASVRDRTFSATGVALDWRVGAGIAFLELFGAWDQISVGRNWLNDRAVRHVWQDDGVLPATPQLLLLSRPIVVDTNPEDTPDRMHVGDEQVVLRLFGLMEIVNWVDAGMPIPEEAPTGP